MSLSSQVYLQSCYSQKRVSARKLISSEEGLPDIIKAIGLLKDATNQSNALLSVRLSAGLDWVAVAEAMQDASLGDAYGTSLQLMDTYVTTSRTLASQHARLASDKLLQAARYLASAAAAHSIAHVDYTKAVENLEQ